MIKKVKILSSLSFQEFPLTEGMVEVEEAILKQIGITKQFDWNGAVIDYTDKSKRIAELKRLLESTDYQAIKYAEGQISVEDYELIKVQRQAWRDEINELEKLI